MNNITIENAHNENQYDIFINGKRIEGVKDLKVELSHSCTAVVTMSFFADEVDIRQIPCKVASKKKRTIKISDLFD